MLVPYGLIKKIYRSSRLLVLKLLSITSVAEAMPDKETNMQTISNARVRVT